MKPTKIYSCTVPAGGAFPLLVQGDYFKIMASTGPVELRGDTFGSIGSVLAGQGMRDTPFNRLEIRDLTGSDNLVSILVADAAFVDDRITGEVSVIDGNIARSKAGGAFAWRLTSFGDANNRAASQLWNPVGSGRRLIVDSINASLTVATSVVYGFFGIALANNTPDRLRSLLGMGGAAAKAQCRLELFPLTNNTLDYLGAAYMPANGSVTLDFKRPIVVMPGQGLIVMSDAANTAMTGTAQFYEESILS